MSPDALSVWVALGVAAAAFLGVAVAFPTAPPPDAAAAANAIDTAAATDYPTATELSVTADEARVGPRRIGLRNDAGTASATFAYGPIAPVRAGPLGRVLAGTAPAAVFEDATAFRNATRRARNRSPVWRPVDRLHVRRVTWRGVDVTLVG